MMQKILFPAWLGVLLLWSCRPAQQKTVPEQGTNTADTTWSNKDETLRAESTLPEKEDGSSLQEPDGFKQFLDYLPEWTSDTIGVGDIYNYDPDEAPEYAEKFEMRNELEEKESMGGWSQFMYKITLDNCYAIFVERCSGGCATSDGFYADRWTRSLMTCTKDGRMVEKVDLGSNMIGSRGFSHVRGTRSPLRLEVKNVYSVVGSGKDWRPPMPSRICRLEYRVNPKDGHISRDTLAVHDCDRYVGEQGESVWKNMTARLTKNRSKGDAIATAYRRPQTVREWIDCFPEWTADSISEHIFDAAGIVSEGVVFPKEFHPVAGQDTALQQVIEMRYGHRITTDSLYILFARKVCSRRNPSDSLIPESFTTHTVLVYSHDGQQKDWHDVTRNFQSKNRTHVSGSRKPFRLHVKEATLLEHDYEHTHYIPVLFRETEWRTTQAGTLATDTLLEEKCRWYPYKHPGVCEPWYEQLSSL